MAGGPVFPVNEIGQSPYAPFPLFIETFNTTTLNLNRWAPPINGGGNLLTPLGAAILNSGTTPGSYILLASVANPDGTPIFTPPSPGFLYNFKAINFEYPILLNTYRFWGFATYPTAVPTVVVPLIEAVGFEIYTDGRLYAVTYQTGVRVVIANLSTAKTQPQDSNVHRYFVMFRGDFIAWAIDDPTNIVAEIQTGALGPNSNNLHLVQLSMTNGTANAALQLNACIVGDWSRSAMTIADGVYSWRKQMVTAAGNAMVALGVPAPIGLQADSGNVSILRTDGAGRLLDANEDLLRTLIREVRVTNRLLLLGLNVDGGDLEAMNQDSDYD